MSKLEQIQQFLAEFQAIRSAKRQARLKRMAEFLPIFETSRRQWRARRPADFNVFAPIVFNSFTERGPHVRLR